ncbi:hypothetical protein A2662_03410 [Candidatus Giovannonibacteria bacterium RIFCSPHIGHO2_01_FULL_45_33]|uniref:Uncharacterized protein n=1 Tax=Candidatus Giovannonibacteria bacterium RIFCSPLOWO2_01_FULL_45_34 TaxID=1798351 RepID=A0A1F5X165_9BACT|nr:MAG: hypothetical protein A2662_03410 [Candidatus Giovannonibacteria bacterium RIFCSPHIGHO2_01_FULL_45_33]OGF70279.1 MAG: hypothetical protein A3C73_01295 [Candidatus Giovannonibacteria bacterium RIFCSPHIGHO2_02_FULL_44_11]OGF81311.1 MAG: hypothetical protein A2930_03550 [Candidatus Giovannonibacteria bacterium RIFCSPLOWO2_01_FULL_45_34]
MSLTEGQIQEITEKAKAWVTSPEGKKQIKETLKRIDEIKRELHEARQVDWRSLDRPMTI